MTYTRVYAIFRNFLFEAQIRCESPKVLFGQFRQFTQVVDGSEPHAFSAKGVDSLRLVVTQVRVSLQSLYIAVVYGDGMHVFRVGCEMREQCVKMQFGEGFVSQLVRTAITA